MPSPIDSDSQNNSTKHSKQGTTTIKATANNAQVEPIGKRIEWSTIVLSQEFFNRIEHIAHKRFYNENLSAESVNYALEKLSDNNYARLHSFANECQPLSYLHTVSKNLIEEYARKKLGRPRPPAWIKKKGSEWIKLWKMLALERLTKQDIIERYSDQLSQQQRYTESNGLKFSLNPMETFSNIEDISQAISTISANEPWCGFQFETVNFSHLQLKKADTELEEMPFLEDTTTSPDAQIEYAEHQALLQILSYRIFLNNRHSTTDSSTKNNAATDHPVAEQPHSSTDNNIQFKLNDIDKKALAMIYEDGKNKTATAKALAISVKKLSNVMNISQQSILETIRSFDYTHQHVDAPPINPGWL